MTAPGYVGRLDAQLAVARLLGAGERVDDVVGLERAVDMVRREVLPDEAPDRPDPLFAQGRDLLELVVLVAEDRLDPVVRDPASYSSPVISKAADSVIPGWSQTSSRSSAPGRGPRSFFGRASTKVSCPSESSAERSWRATTPCPRLNQ